MTAAKQLVQIKKALNDLGIVPEDVYIGENNVADKVEWLCHRLARFDPLLRKGKIRIENINVPLNCLIDELSAQINRDKDE